jgi:hypothetical protein
MMKSWVCDRKSELHQSSVTPRQLRAPLPVEQPAHLPELLLRVPDVQGQGRAAEQPPQSLLQARLALDDDLYRPAVPGGSRGASVGDRVDIDAFNEETVAA